MSLRITVYSLLFLLLPCPGAWALDGTLLVIDSIWFQPGDLVKIDCASGQRTILVSGAAYGPCFSPDASQIAYWKDGKIWTIPTDGSGSPVEICDTYVTVYREQAMNWPDDGYIYWSEQGAYLYRVNIATGKIETVHTSSERNLYMVSVSRDSQRAACSKNAWEVWAIDLETHEERNFGSGCQGTISANGQYVTHNLDGHEEANIHRFSDGSVYTTITKPADRSEFNMHRFSKHSSDHVVFTADENNAYVCEIHSNTSTYIGRGAAWDYLPPARIALDPDTLSFQAEAGGSAPPSREVTVSNSGDGSLNDVSVSGYAAWLDVSRSGSGNSQILTNTVDPSGLSAGNHATTVTVSCDTAENSPLTYEVNLDLAEGLQLTTIQVVPARSSLLTGESVAVTATPRDQFDDPIPAVIAWSVSGGGSMAPESSGTAVTEHVSDFTSDSSEGTFTVTAESGGVQGQTALEVSTSVVNQPPVVNAGNDVSIELGTPAWLDGSVSDDGLPEGTLVVQWSQVDGPGTATIDTPDAQDSQATFSQAGTYNLELTAGDGELEASDTVTVIVVEPGEPAIVLIRPNGGENWMVGTRENIQWSAVNLDDVTLRYSTDNGENWKLIESSVDDSLPTWGDYPWTVPDDPSAHCLVRISGYFGEAPTQSAAVFAITEPSTDGGSGAGDGDLTVSGGCSGCTAPGSGTPDPGMIGLFLSMAVWCRFRRRTRTGSDER
jgi:hypothetical protein